MTLTIGPSNIGDEYIPTNCDIVKMENFKKENALELADKDERSEIVYNYFSENNYTIYKHEGTTSYFVSHQKLAEVADFKEFKMKNQLLYQLDKGTKVVESGVDTTPILVVQFVSSNPESKSIEPRERFVHNPVLGDILDETYRHVTLLKIVDNNLSFGSYFFNTASYQGYESDIIGLIKEQLAELGITEGRLKFVGAGTGAFAAMYFAKYFNVSSLSYVLEGFLKTPRTAKYLLNEESIVNKYQLALGKKSTMNHLVCLVDKHPEITDILLSDKVANVTVEKVNNLTKEKMLEVTSLFMNDKTVF